MASNNSDNKFLPAAFSLLASDEQELLRQRYGNDQGNSLSAGWWVCIAVATSLLVIRLFNRVLYSGSEKQRLRLDDWFLAGAWFALVGAVTCAEVMRSELGLGSGLEAAFKGGLEIMLKLNLIATVLGMVSIAFTKLSLVTLYTMWVLPDDQHAVSSPLPQQTMRISLGIFTSILCIAGVAFPAAHVFACGTIPAHWNPGISQATYESNELCLQKLMWLADVQFAVDMFTDLVFLFLAGPIVYAIHATKRGILAILIAFAIAACSITAAAMRVSVSHSSNSVACLITWLIAEASLLLILASGLSLHTLFARLCRSVSPLPRPADRMSVHEGSVRWSTTLAPGSSEEDPDPYGVPQYSLHGSSGSGSASHKTLAHNSWSKASFKGSFKGSGVFGSLGRSSGDVYREGLPVGSGSLYDGIPEGGAMTFGGVHLPSSRGGNSSNPGEEFEIKPVEKMRIIRQDGKLMVEKVVESGSSAHGSGLGGLWGDEENPADITPYEPLDLRLLMDPRIPHAI